jgi:hypothetical protein
MKILAYNAKNKLYPRAIDSYVQALLLPVTIIIIIIFIA